MALSNYFRQPRRHHRLKQGVLGWGDRHGILTQHNRIGVCCNPVVLFCNGWPNGREPTVDDHRCYGRSWFDLHLVRLTQL